MISVLKLRRKVLMIHPNIVVRIHKRYDLAALHHSLKHERPGCGAKVPHKLVDENLLRDVWIVGRAAPDQMPDPLALDHPFVKAMIGLGIVVQIVGCRHIGFHRLHGKANAVAKFATPDCPPSKLRPAPSEDAMSTMSANLPDDR